LAFHGWRRVDPGLSHVPISALKILRLVGLWAPVAAYMTLIHFLSSRSSLPAADLVWDKLAHTAAYCLFGVLCLRAVHGGLRKLRLWPSLLAMLLTLAYAAIDELHQSRVPGREASAADWAADALGAFAACLLVSMWVLIRSRFKVSAASARPRRRRPNPPRR
jgi:VanZ family protein